jgi:hypothetical protein
MNTGKRRAILRKVLIGTVLFLFGVAVWPTPWRWLIVNDSGTVIRINRITGTFLIINGNEDNPLEEPDEDPDDNDQIDSPQGSSLNVLRVSVDALKIGPARGHRGHQRFLG